MFSNLLQRLASGRGKVRKNRRRTLDLAPLEERRLLSSVTDLTTAATVSTIRNGVAVVQPMKSAYATNAQSVQVNFSASDPDDPGATLTTHFNITDTTTGAVPVNHGTGSSSTLSQQGVYLVQFWSTDSDDSEAVAAHSIVIAIDRSAPTITIDTVSPNILWPPNGKFVTVTVTGVASDSLSGVNASSLGFHVVDEYGKVEPAGPITSVTPAGPTPFGGYADVGFTFQVMLQARRFGFDRDGRHYRIDVTARDIAGNTGGGSAVVIVPHDMGRNHGYHGTGHEGSGGGDGTGKHQLPNHSSGSAGEKTHGKGSHGSKGHGHGGGSLGVQPGTGASNSGSGTPIGDQGNAGQGHGQGKGNGHGDGNDQGNGNENGNGNGNGNGHGNGNGGGDGNGNGNGNGNGGGNGNGNGKGGGGGNGHGKGGG